MTNKTIILNQNDSILIDAFDITKPFLIRPFIKDQWIQNNEQKDQLFRKDVKKDLYERIDNFIPELKQRYQVNDEELEVLIDGYISGYFDLPPDTPDWIRDIIELS